MTNRKESGNSGNDTGNAGSNPSLPTPLKNALRDIFRWVRKESYDAALIGGVAVCLQAVIRETNDIDILILTTDAPETVLDSLMEAGYEPRFSDPVEFALATRVLLVRHKASGVAVDVTLGMLPFEQECIESAIAMDVGESTVPVVTPEALCVMKLIAGRKRDLRDVAVLLETYPELDRAWILDHVGQYSVLMESPELLDRASRMLSDEESTR